MTESRKQQLLEKPNIKGDRVNICLLILMYSFQGALIGLASAFSMIFQDRKVTYEEQAEFSIGRYVYSFKLLWAPLVDCIFSERLGRRKTWVIPSQYLMGITLFFLSINLDDWLGSENGTRQPRIRPLTVVFVICTFFSSTQDIALDGWSVTMLQRRNVTFGGVCQNIGTTVGTLLSLILFIILDSKDFCNRFRSVPQDHGFVSLAGLKGNRAWTFFVFEFPYLYFGGPHSREVLCRQEAEKTALNVGRSSKMTDLLLLVDKFGTTMSSIQFTKPLLSDFIFYWSVILMISTTLIFIFKSDNSLEVIEEDNFECKLELRESYQQLWKIFKLPSMLQLSLILCTYAVGLGPQEGVAHLEIMKAGVPRENFVLFTAPTYLFKIILSIVLRRFVAGAHSMHSFITNFVLMLITGVVLAVVLFFSQFVKESDNKLPIWYNWVLFSVFNARTVFRYLLILSAGTFFCRISDPRYGGMYLTLMNTMINIGSSWPVTLCLWCVDLLTIKTCIDDKLRIDGFYSATIIFTAIGVLWLCWSKKQIYKLESLDASAWIVEKEEAITSEKEKLPSLAATPYPLFES